MDYEEIENWSEYFKSKGLNVFKVMEAAIEVAYCYQPEDFYQERPRMAELLFGKPSIKLFHGKDKEKILESMGKTPEEVAEKAIADTRGVDQPNQNKRRHVFRIKLKRNKQVQSSEVEPNTGSASKIQCDDEHRLLPLQEDAKEKGISLDNTSKVQVKKGEGRAYDDDDQVKVNHNLQSLEGVQKKTTTMERVKGQSHTTKDLAKTGLSKAYDDQVKVNQNDDKLNMQLLEDVQKKVATKERERPSSIRHDAKGPSHATKDLPKTKAYDDQKQVNQSRLESSKRKLELNYRQCQDRRKKVQVIDFKDVPTTTKNVGFRNKINSKVVRVSHGFRRAVF